MVEPRRESRKLLSIHCRSRFWADGLTGTWARVRVPLCRSRSRTTRRPRVHPTAIVAKGRSSSRSWSSGRFAYSRASFTLGAGSRWPSRDIAGRTTIGSRCQVHHGAVIGNHSHDSSTGRADRGPDRATDTVVREYATIARHPGPPNHPPPWGGGTERRVHVVGSHVHAPFLHPTSLPMSFSSPLSPFPPP